MRYLRRRLGAELVRVSASDLGRGVILTGARQTGKTTLLERELVPPFEMYSFDEPLVRADLLERPAAVWIRRGRSYIFDEVQKAPEFLGTVKVILDRGGAKQRVILSGSAQIQLLAGVSETLAGRVVTFELYPLLAAELAGLDGPVVLEDLARCRTAAEARDLLDAARFASPAVTAAVGDAFGHLVRFGGMPRLVALASDDERWLWLREYCRTYLQRDVADLGRVADLDDFLRLQRVAARRTAGLVNFADLARDADMAPLTAKRYLRYLELSYQAFLLPAFRRPGLARLAKAPRLHWLDLGVQRVLAGQRDGLTGEQLETAVVAEVRKTFATARIDAELAHLRTHDGREVDLLVRTPAGYLAMEIKSTRRPASVHTRHLRGLERFLDAPLLASLLVHAGRTITELGPGLYTIPPAILFAPSP